MSVLDGNSQKTPLAQSLHKLGRAKAQDAVAMLGKGLPCTVTEVHGPGIVTVNFAVATSPAPLPQVKLAVNKPASIKYPIQVGDIGVALSADLKTGGLTGLGAGTPNLQDTVANLSALTFFWLGHADEEFLFPDALGLNDNIHVTAAELGFFGEAPVAKQSLPAAASDLPSAIALANAIRDALIAYGLAS